MGRGCQGVRCERELSDHSFLLLMSAVSSAVEGLSRPLPCLFRPLVSIRRHCAVNVPLLTTERGLNTRKSHGFAVQNVDDALLPEWVIRQAGQLGLETLAVRCSDELMQATRTTRGHLAVLHDDLFPTGGADRPDWRIEP